MSQPIPSESLEYERCVDGVRRTNTELLAALQLCWEQLSLYVANGEQSPEDKVALDKAHAALVESNGDVISVPSKTITIHVEGGLVQEVTGIPVSYQLRVEDYDLDDPSSEGWDAEKKCAVTIYEGGAA